MIAEPSLWQFISHAGLVVRLVMLILLGASLITWAIIFQRRTVLSRVEKATERFEADFWSGIELSKLHGKLESKRESLEGVSAIFYSGFQEFNRLTRQGVPANAMGHGIDRAMRAAASKELEVIERYLSFLATVGSISPYVGLFGTVWGIMTSFTMLSAVTQASLATVAPGIAEALVATAMGLFAAIPAVVAYNYYSNRVEKLATNYDIFQEEFSSILHRRIHATQKEEV